MSFVGTVSSIAFRTFSLKSIQISSDKKPKKTQKQFWNCIKNTRKDNTGVSPLRKDGILIDDTKQEAEILNEQ
jgi:hypothetical protein